MKTIKIADIAIDGETQQREKIDTDIVSEYAEAMRCGAKFPPMIVFFDGAVHHLADGFHRWHAHRAAEITEASVEVIDGTVRDARWYSFSANGTHGLRLTNADKRKSVKGILDDSVWSRYPDDKIAKHCHVSRQFVHKLRQESVNSLQILSENRMNAGWKEPCQVKNNALRIGPRVLNKINGRDPDMPKEEESSDTDDSLAVAAGLVTELSNENEALKDRLAVEMMAGTEEDKAEALGTIQELRDHIKALEAELDAVKSSRDIFMRENAQMKRQLGMQRKEIANLKVVK